MATNNAVNAGDLSQLITGPLSSTDQGVVRWVGTDGTEVEDSDVRIDDDGHVILPVPPTENDHAATKEYVDDTFDQVILDGDKGDITVSVTGTVWDINPGAVVDSMLDTGINANKISNGSVSNTEFNYLNGVSNPIQTQIDAKQDTIIGAASTVVTTNLTVDKVLVSNGAGKIVASTINESDILNLSGAVGNLQDQINEKVSLDGDTMTGYLTLVGDPISTNHAANKGYVDTLVAGSDGNKGDITVSSGGTVWTINNSSITNAKVATGIGATKIADGSVGNIAFQYIANLTSDAQTQLNNLQPAGNYITALTGDITASGPGSATATIANDAVTYAKIQNVAANSVLARAANSSGDVSAVAVSASQLLGRGSTGDIAAITLGTNLSMSGTTLNATGGGGGGGDVSGPGTSVVGNLPSWSDVSGTTLDDSGIAAADLVTSSAAITDHAIVRGDGGTTGVQDSGVLISDADEVSGVAQLDVDNIRLNGNTISSTDTDGNLILAPNGTGHVQAPIIQAPVGSQLLLRNTDGETVVTLDPGGTGGDNVEFAGPIVVARSAVDYLVLGGTSGEVVLEASGASTDIDVNLKPLGTGQAQVNGSAIYHVGGTDVALADGGTGASLTDPEADRIMFWDDSAGSVAWLEAGSGLTITNTTIAASGGGDATSFDVAQTGHGFVVGDVIRATSTANTYAKAQADSAANAEVVGYVSVVDDANNFTYTTEGIVSAGVPTNTAGTVYFLSPSSAGALTATEPTTAGQISKPLLTILESATTAYFHNYRGMLLTDPTSAGTVDNGVVEGRLTLTTGTPVMTSTVTAATTVYFTPYKGNYIALYDGSADWDVVQFTEISLSLSGYTANKNYDIWCYNNGGTATLESTVWTDNTTRATALAKQDGVYVKSGATTRRYLGTIRINSSGGQCDFELGGLAVGGAIQSLYVWNYYNRVPVTTYTGDTTDYWIYTGGWRSANNSATYRSDFIVGVQEDIITASYNCYIYTNGTANVGVGYDTTSAFSGSPSGMYAGQYAFAEYRTQPTAGYHYVQAVEAGFSGTSYFYGDDGAPTSNQSILRLSHLC